MGARPFWYFVPYQPEIKEALRKLRRREFEAGRYNPVLPFVQFPVDVDAPSPGAQHLSIEHAREAADVDGTRSILDIEGVSDTVQFGMVARLDDAVLEGIFQTRVPTRQMIESNMEFFDQIERGHAIYIIVYKNDRPDELFFAGYSFD